MGQTNRPLDLGLEDCPAGKPRLPAHTACVRTAQSVEVSALTGWALLLLLVPQLRPGFPDHLIIPVSKYLSGGPRSAPPFPPPSCRIAAYRCISRGCRASCWFSFRSALAFTPSAHGCIRSVGCIRTGEKCICSLFIAQHKCQTHTRARKPHTSHNSHSFNHRGPSTI